MAGLGPLLSLLLYDVLTGMVMALDAVFRPRSMPTARTRAPSVPWNGVGIGERIGPPAQPCHDAARAGHPGVKHLRSTYLSC